MFNIFDDFCGIAGNDGVRRDVLRHHGIGPDDAAVAEVHARRRFAASVNRQEKFLRQGAQPLRDFRQKDCL